MRLMPVRRLIVPAFALALLSAADLASAQSRTSLEATVGWAGFVDDATKHQLWKSSFVQVDQPVHNECP
jgi:hypothetical protein